MPYTEKEIHTFLSKPLSPSVLRALLNSVEAYGALRCAMLCDEVDLCEQMQLIRELRFISVLSGQDFTHENILLAQLFSNEDNGLKGRLYAYRNCKNILHERLSLCKIITATDLLRVDHCIKHSGSDLLGDSFYAKAYSELAGQINEGVFELFYNLENGHHIFIGIAVAYYLLKIKLPTHEFDILALDVFFTAVVCDKMNLPNAPIWLAKYAVLNIDWGYTDTNDSFESAVIKFLEYLKDEFVTQCLMIQDKKDKSESIAQRIRQKLPEAYSKRLAEMLRNNLHMRNVDFVNTLQVTPATAIKYIKMLENERFISGFKQGREKVYINRELISLIRE